MGNVVPGVAAVILAGGSGTRLGADRNKVYLDLGGQPMLAWSLATLDANPEVTSLVVAIRPGDEDHFEAVRRSLGPRSTPLHTVSGGETRSASEMAALALLSPDIDAGEIEVVLIHDGARPFISQGLINRVVAAARANAGAIPGLVPDRAIFGRSSDGSHAEVHPPATLRRVQTPQAFAAPLLADAYRLAREAGFDGVDTAEVVARFGRVDALVVEGDPDNIKVTTTADLDIARRVAASGTRTMPR